MTKSTYPGIVFFIIFLLTCTAFSVDIIQLHKNDINGKPAAPYQIGAQVTVEGIVTAATNIYSQINFEVFIQDESAGINLFKSRNIPMQVNLGDRLRVTGTIQQYRGLTEIQSFSELTLISSNNPPPEPLVLTCSQVANSFFEDYSEPNESRLIRVNNVRKVEDIDQYSCTIEDYTGTCILFMDVDTKLPDPPDGLFDVIGILKQYDRSSEGPLMGGYEISPRFASDFISKSGPIFLQRPRETDVTTHSVQLQWRTDRPSTTLFRFGVSESYNSGAIGDSTGTILHHVTLEGLQPATMYHGRAFSTDSTGTSQSDDIVFMTASEASSGTIDVFFTKSVDAKYARMDTANGNNNLASIIIDLINRAQYSLDVCYYSFTHYNIAEALRSAKKRGVSVRFIYESKDNENNLNILGLRDFAGIPIINDRFGSNADGGAMHNKFIIIDHRDISTALDDYLWVGSANATDGGTFDNAENMLLIQDECLCAAYTAEFNEMWGSDTEVPDAGASRFGFRKKDNTPHLFRIGGRLVQQYMSPTDDTEDAIIRVIEQSQSSFYFCILAFTSTGILKALENKFFNLPGYHLRGVFERGDANSFSSKYPIMSGQTSGGWQPPADVHTDIIPKYLHHKYALIDLGTEHAEPVVITGSHNWSVNANTVNDENTLIIHDRRIANIFVQEFAARYHESGGSAELYSKVDADAEQTGIAAPTDYQLLQNYPNPFNQNTVITCWVPDTNNKATIDIYNTRGERLARLPIARNAKKWVRISWDGTDDGHNKLPSGIYFAKTSGGSVTIKIIIVR